MLSFQGNGGKCLIGLINLNIYNVEYHLILIIFFNYVNDNVRTMILVHTVQWSKSLSTILEFLFISVGQVLLLE